MDISPETINQILDGRFPAVNGVRVEHAEAGRAVCSLKIEGYHHHPGGIVHGGVAYTLADTAMAWAILPGLEEGQAPVTIEQKMTYLDAAIEGELQCEARVIKRGKRIVLLEATVTNGDKRVAMSTASFYIQGA